MNNGHARLSPSGADKWMLCAGSIAMEDGLPNVGSEYSDEGTAAHALASMCLQDGQHPAAFAGRVLHIINGKYQPNHNGLPLDGETLRSFTVNADMIAAVNTYVISVRHYLESSGVPGTLYVEESLPIDHITGEDGASGTGDAIIITADRQEIQVHDLKYGMGVRVFAENNRQMQMYALGAVKKFFKKGEHPERVRCVIHQPRISTTPSEWSCTYDELLAFGDEAHQAAKNAGIAFEYRDNWKGKSTDYLKAGEKQCRWCLAKATCPTLAKFVQDSVGAEFEVIADEQKAIDGKQASNLIDRCVPTDLEALGLKLRCVDLIEMWLKAVRGRVEAALFEHNNDEAAQKALGYKLVEGKKGNRAWTDEAQAEALLKKMRFKTEEIYDFKLRSPTKVCDELLKDQPKRLDKILPLVGQADGKPSVAVLGDKREALVIKPVVDDFAVEAAPPEDGSDLA